MYESYMAVAPRPRTSRAARPHGRAHAHSRTTGRRTSKKLDDAGDARLRRQRHVPARAHRRLLQAARRRAKDAGWQREHMSPNRLAILPDLTHYEIFLAPELAATVLPFLDGKRRSQSWAEQASG